MQGPRDERNGVEAPVGFPCNLRPGGDLAARHLEGVRQLRTCRDTKDGRCTGEGFGERLHGAPALLGHVQRPRPQTTLPALAETLAVDEITGSLVLQAALDHEPFLVLEDRSF